MRTVIKQMEKHWEFGWVVAINGFMFAVMNMIYPMSIEVANDVCILLCRMGLLFTLYVFFFGILDYIRIKHTSKGKKGGEDE